tara:strand:+ start:109 stop:414 length:306 start_codon:yes stop_codon:yes gene_type:complete
MVLKKAKEKKFNLGVTIAIGSQIAGGLFYINTLIADIGDATKNIEVLQSEVQQLQGQMNRATFDIERLKFQNNFQNMDIEENIEDLEVDIEELERDIKDLF